MPPFRRTRSDHRVEVITFDDGGDPAFVGMCTCGTVSLPFATKDEAFRWGRGHGAEVDENVQVLTGEGGVGWQCMFCGSVIEEDPLRVFLHWTNGGVDDEQWYAAHRTCLAERMSKEEQLAPRFELRRGDAR